jgi:hypothetical protein
MTQWREGSQGCRAAPAGGGGHEDPVAPDDERPRWLRPGLVSWQSVVLAPCVGPVAWLAAYWVASSPAGPDPNTDFFVLPILLFIWMAWYVVTTTLLLMLRVGVRVFALQSHGARLTLLVLVTLVQSLLALGLFGATWLELGEDKWPAEPLAIIALAGSTVVAGVSLSWPSNAASKQASLQRQPSPAA